MTCKGICLRHRAQKPVDSGRYASGQKRCQVCEIFIKWDLLSCPCCGFKLRTKPHNSKLKKRFAVVKNIKTQEIKYKRQFQFVIKNKSFIQISTSLK